ncbi:hypothetical protein EVG20_g5473 [Dentipellis fragilis]|uniref:Uncharacterized protein n=1 Tax=Dentipellis fragilis TaxID=205917 RepID=A0A4Y9YWW9_9AGAM|nr:hypothetical protein EVG20_g5473 [Dentipellis fragilis]
MSPRSGRRPKPPTLVCVTEGDLRSQASGKGDAQAIAGDRQCTALHLSHLSHLKHPTAGWRPVVGHIRCSAPIHTAFEDMRIHRPMATRSTCALSRPRARGTQKSSQIHEGSSPPMHASEGYIVRLYTCHVVASASIDHRRLVTFAGHATRV